MSYYNRVVTEDQLEKCYKYYRERHVHEDHLIIHRTMVFATLQAFMFTSVALLAGQFTGYQFEFLSTCFAAVGLAVCFTTFISVRAAQQANAELREQWDSISTLSGSSFLPPLAGGGMKQNICLRGSISSFVLPIVLAFAWCFVVATIWLVENPAQEIFITDVSSGSGP